MLRKCISSSHAGKFPKEDLSQLGSHCNLLQSYHTSPCERISFSSDVMQSTKHFKTLVVPKLIYVQFYYFIIGFVILQPLLLNIAKDILPFCLNDVVAACRPGVGNGGVRRPHRKLRPLLRFEYVPKMSELTLGASGPALGRIERGTKRFRDELFANWNPDIIFEDREQNNEDRYMTEVNRLQTLTPVSTQFSDHPMEFFILRSFKHDHLFAPVKEFYYVSSYYTTVKRQNQGNRIVSLILSPHCQLTTYMCYHAV